MVADAPARALVIFGDGLMQSLLPSHSQLHALAYSGACGFLALRNLSPHMDNSSRSLFEMQQLLDAHRYFVTDTTSKSFGDSISKEFNIPSIAERFMGMKAALITTSEPVASLGKSLGFTIGNGKVKLSFADSSTTCNTAPQLPNSASVASQLLELLGLRAPPNESNSFELVILHIGDGSSTDKDENSRGYLDWIDALVGEIKTLMKPGTEAYDHLYLSLVLGYGNEAAIQASTNTIECLCLEPSAPPPLRALHPQQTYKMKDGKLVDGVRDHHPLLVVHQMDGVTRRDFSASFSFQEFQKNGCNLTILADRFIHEIAFKLWKAPNYGA